VHIRINIHAHIGSRDLLNNEAPETSSHLGECSEIKDEAMLSKAREGSKVKGDWRRRKRELKGKKKGEGRKGTCTIKSRQRTRNAMTTSQETHKKKCELKNWK